MTDKYKQTAVACFKVLLQYLMKVTNSCNGGRTRDRLQTSDLQKNLSTAAFDQVNRLHMKGKDVLRMP